MWGARLQDFKREMPSDLVAKTRVTEEWFSIGDEIRKCFDYEYVDN